MTLTTTFSLSPSSLICPRLLNCHLDSENLSRAGPSPPPTPQREGKTCKSNVGEPQPLKERGNTAVPDPWREPPPFSRDKTCKDHLSDRPREA
jgi:hypothetical protein